MPPGGAPSTYIEEEWAGYPECLVSDPSKAQISRKHFQGKQSTSFLETVPMSCSFSEPGNPPLAPHSQQHATSLHLPPSHWLSVQGLLKSPPVPSPGETCRVLQCAAVGGLVPCLLCPCCEFKIIQDFNQVPRVVSHFYLSVMWPML